MIIPYGAIIAEAAPVGLYCCCCWLGRWPLAYICRHGGVAAV